MGFGAKDIEKANTLKLHLERQDRLAKLEHKAKVKRLAELEEKYRLLEYRNRVAHSSSDSSNYDTPPGSPGTTTATKKRKKESSRKIWNKSLSHSHSALATQE